MAGMGPAPKQNAVRKGRGLAQPLMQLPANGRQGPAPKWPLSVATRREKELWQDLWGTPQAVAWEQIGAVRVVARYARLLAMAEEPGSFEVRGLLPETRQLEDRLGLSPMAMLRLRWQIEENEPTQPVVAVASGDQDDLARRRRIAERRKAAG